MRRRHPWPKRLKAVWQQRCPRCLEGEVFRGRGLTMHYACPRCRVVFGRENGYFTGAMIVSYMLAVPLLAVLALGIYLLTAWRAELVILVAGLLFLPFAPSLFRSSRVIWMHFDRLVDPSFESEHFAPPAQRRTDRAA
jgi:uncharacterized protein (DUF983 family)